MKRILLIITVLFFAANTNAQSKQKVYKQKTVNQEEYIQVYVDAKAKVFVAGEKITLKDLEQKLITIQKKNGIIHYATEQVKKKSVTKKISEVMSLIIKYQLPVKFYKDKSFTIEENR